MLLNYHIGSSWFASWSTTSAGSPDTSLAKPHPNSNTQQTKNVIVNVVVQQHGRKLLKMGILMPETCWVSKKKNKSSKWQLVGFLFFSYQQILCFTLLHCDNTVIWTCTTCRTLNQSAVPLSHGVEGVGIALLLCDLAYNLVLFLCSPTVIEENSKEPQAK